jgi:hypothetical protein
VCAWIKGTKCTKNWAGRAQILVSENKKAARCPVFLENKKEATRTSKVFGAFASSESGEPNALKFLLV